jgi:hypothetical protein
MIGSREAGQSDATGAKIRGGETQARGPVDGRGLPRQVFGNPCSVCASARSTSGLTNLEMPFLKAIKSFAGLSSLSILPSVSFDKYELPIVLPTTLLARNVKDVDP